MGDGTLTRYEISCGIMLWRPWPIGVFAAYVSCHGHVFIDRALYLPRAWTNDPARMAAAHVPDGTSFATKPGLVAGTAEEISGTIDPSRWQRLSAGEGTKGTRLHDWVYCELADLDAAEYAAAHTGQWTRGPLIRRNIADGEMAFFSTWCPTGTGIETLVKMEGYRWAIEDSFETAKNELGLDHNETGSWPGWHRHVSLVMLAFAMLAAIRHHANATTPQKTLHRATNIFRRH